MDVDLILRGARVLTLDEDRPRADAVAVLGAQIVAVGTSDDLDGLRAEVDIDLDGACVTPGFGDAHNHMAWFGLNLAAIDLVGVTSLQELYRRVRMRADETAQGALIVGSGYDDNILGSHPDRDELDRAAGGRPVWLTHRSGHIAMVSTSLAGDLGLLDGTAICPEGGVIVTDTDGQPTGVLQEQAQNIVIAHVTPYPLDDLADAVGRASGVFAAEGLTHVTECGIGRGWLGKSPLEAAAYQQAIDNGLLRVRTQLMPCVDALHEVRGDDRDDMTFGLDLGLRTGFGDDHLRIGPVKIWTDGSLLGRTAAMTQDYCGCHSSAAPRRGYLQDDPETMRRAMLAAHRGGWDVAAHAIGDAAVDFVLDVVEQAQRQWPRPEARHRVEHAGITSLEQVRRFAALGLTPVPQPRFLHDIGDSMLAAVGRGRADSLYRHRSFLAAGCRVPGSSDRPVVDGRPLAGMSSMILRETASGTAIGPQEAVDAWTALAAYTRDAAWIARDEQRRGRIRTGMLADLVVLAADPTTIDPHDLPDLPVLATLLGGRATHDTGFGLPPAATRSTTASQETR